MSPSPDPVEAIVGWQDPKKRLIKEVQEIYWTDFVYYLPKYLWPLPDHYFSIPSQTSVDKSVHFYG